VRQAEANPSGGQFEPVLSPEQRAKLLNERDELDKEAIALQNANKLPEAIADVEKMLAMEQKVLGNDSPDVANSQAFLADLHMAREEFPASRTCRQAELAIRTKLNGPENWRTIDARLALDDIDRRSKLSAADTAKLKQADDLLDQVVKLCTQDHLQQAIPLAKQCLELRQQVLGNDDLLVAEIDSWIGELYLSSGQAEQAIPFYRSTVEIRHHVLGDHHPSYATSLNNLATSLTRLGNLSEAETLFRQANKIDLEALGKDDHSYQIDQKNLADALGKIAHDQESHRDFDQAIAARNEIVAITTEVYGKDHWRVTDARLDMEHTKLLSKLNAEQARQLDRASDLLNQVDKLQRQGKYLDALPLAAEALQLCQAALPQENRLVADNFRQLAYLQEKAGKFDAAAASYQQALEIREKVCGAEHPDTARSLSNLADCYAGQGKYTVALPLCQRAVQIFEKTLGPDDHDTGTAVNSLTIVYVNQGKLTEALPLLQRVVGINEKAGPDSTELAASLGNLASALDELGRYAEAIPLSRRALQIDEKKLGPDHPDVVFSLNHLAHLYMMQGDYSDAFPLLQRALTIREAALGPEHPLTAESLNNLAVIYDDQGNYSEALPLLQKALKIKLKVFGQDHPETIRTLDSLGMLYYSKGNYSQAAITLQQALNSSEKVLGPEHPDTALYLNNLALIYDSQGKYAEALPLYQRSLKIDEAAYGPEHPDTAQCIKNLAVLYEKQKNYAEALPLYQRAAAGMIRHLESTAAVQSERQQLINVQQIRFYLDCVVSCAMLSGGDPSTTYEQMLAWKGAVTLRQRLDRAARRGDDPQEKKLWEELETVTTRLATLNRASPSADKKEAWQKELADLSQQKEDLEVELSGLSADFRKVRSQNKLTVDQLAQKLPADAVLIDLLQYSRRVDSKQPDGQPSTDFEDRVAAFVVRSAAAPTVNTIINSSQNGNGQTAGTQQTAPVAMIDLGPVDPIDDAVQKWRETYGSPIRGIDPVDQPAAKLRRLVWEPLVPYLKNAKTVLISPDGSLSRFPWCALPGSKPDTYLIEEIGIAILPVPQMLPELLEDQQLTSKHTDPSLLLVGNVDYGAAPGKPRPLSSDNSSLIAGNTRSAVRGSEKMNFPSLPGTAKEINLIEQLYRQRFVAGQQLDLKGAGATQERVREEAPQHQYLHLATHGFFAPQMLSGVGAFLNATGDKIFVGRIIPGGAAARDGRLKPRDEIIAVAQADQDWTSLAGKSVPETSALTRGPAGTQVRLKVQPAAGGPVVEYQLTRRPYAQRALTDVDSKDGKESQITNYHPGLLSGIVLAGANLPRQADQDDGIMTALEVSSLDLQHVDLAVLSACETGLGQTAGGEGTLGLQRAFQVAGARTTISSLWSVDDAATQALMVEFYSRLWDKNHPLGKLEALRQAQLAMLHHYDPRAAKLVDRSRGLEPDVAPSETSDRLSPKYWAAFQLSGDWR
jgi:tetratricopeptide (TPR) repeat protein/CHAT domain-containing protein